MNEKIMYSSIGTIDLEELKTLTVSGGNDPTTMATPTTIIASSIECVSIVVTAVSAISDIATNFFSCGKFC